MKMYRLSRRQVSRASCELAAFPFLTAIGLVWIGCSKC